MEHNSVQFAVVEATNPCCWKWIVFLDANGLQIGIAPTRTDAVIDAELAVEEALERALAGSFRKSTKYNAACCTS